LKDQSGTGFNARFPDLTLPGKQPTMLVMIKQVVQAGLQAGRELGQAVLDEASERTGWVAVRVTLQRAANDREVTLEVPGYRQINSYACGAVAAAMVVKYFRPQVSFARIYDAVDPTQRFGAGTTRVMRALRSLGVGVSRKTDLTFADICDAIDADRPIIVCVKTGDRGVDHWVVIYGYGRRPNRVFVAGQGLPFFARQRTAWPKFRKVWSPRGEGLLCWKAKARKPRPAPRICKK
jgi:hypothetical protein